MKKIFLIIPILLLSGCSLFYDEYEMPEEVSIKIKEDKYEVYSGKTINDLIEDKNVKILNENEKLDTKKTGKQETTIEYEYEDRKYKYIVNYEVMDTLPPTVIYTKEYDYAYVGDETSKDINFCDSANFIDNYDRKPTCKIEGTYDINTVGTYELKYIISDKDNNTTTKDITFEVMEEPTEIKDEDYEEETEEEEETLDFKYIIDNYKTDNTMIGIDVSRWQGDIDFKKVKEAGCEFVIMRMAVSNGPYDEIGLDSKFKQNLKNAKAAGLKIGVYVYTSPSSTKEIKKQAEFVLDELDKTKLDFPIAYDFENWGDIRSLKINLYDLLSYIDEFKNIVKKDGYEVMLYSSKKYLGFIWPKETYPVWLAHYIDETNYDGDYIMWQMANNGRIDGIDTNVDIDIYYKRED